MVYSLVTTSSFLPLVFSTLFTLYSTTPQRWYLHFNNTNKRNTEFFSSFPTHTPKFQCDYTLRSVNQSTRNSKNIAHTHTYIYIYSSCKLIVELSIECIQAENEDKERERDKKANLGFEGCKKERRKTEKQVELNSICM